MQPVVRAICCLIALIASASEQTSTASPAAPENLRVTLLGTGTPNPRPDRFGPSTLVEAGTERLVFDCGRSCTTRLWQLRVPLGSVKLFITHLHSDHTVGIPDLWLTGWLNLPYGMRKEPFHVWGPQGTSDMMSALQKAYQEDIRIRREFDPNLTAQQVGVDAHDITEGLVYEHEGVRITAFKVRHSTIKDAFGYRVDYNGHSVVLSGDMAPNANFRKYAKGADVVVHEVGVANPELLRRSERLRELLESHHSSPEDAGRDFAEIKPKLAVFTHYSLFSGQGFPEPTVAEILARTRTVYSGPLEAGEDLMSISIGDKVTVQHLSH